MSFIYSTVYSKVLRQDIHLDLFMPQDKPEYGITKPKAVIYFLHGLGSSEKQFREYTATNRYARDNDVAVVYISAPQSFYNDMKYGLPYYTYITEELPQILKSIYGLDFPREKTFIAGLSMGGYGAFRIGLSRPDIFGACASLSSACDIRGMAERIKQMPEIKGDYLSVIPVFGEKLEISEDRDLFRLADKAAKMPKEQQPRIFLCMGKQDPLPGLIEGAHALRDKIRESGIENFKYMEWDGGHDYLFWDRAMMHIMAYFLENDYDKEKIGYWSCPSNE